MRDFNHHDITPEALSRQSGSNRLLRALGPDDYALLDADLEAVELAFGTVLFEPGEDVVKTYFPALGTVVSLVLIMEDGRVAEAATIGREGAVGGIVSAGHKPAYARAVVHAPGFAVRIDTARLEEAKHRSPRLRDVFARYADALLAQVFQSVVCNALHPLEARCARWLLTMRDRVGDNDLPITQELLSQILGVQRTTVSRIASTLQRAGMIRYTRGRIQIIEENGLRGLSCECYAAVDEHFRRLLSGPAVGLSP